MDEWLKLLIATLVGAGATIATGYFGYASKDEELRVHLVEIAIGILSADPSKTDLTPARSWAMDIIDQKSGVKFSDENHKALLHQPINTGDWTWKKDVPFAGNLKTSLRTHQQYQIKVGESGFGSRMIVVVADKNRSLLDRHDYYCLFDDPVFEIIVL